MFESFLLPEAVIREDGTGPELSLESAQGRSLLLTLGITRIIEQQSLDLTIWGSADKVNWGQKPLHSFPQKFYCGSYQMLLDLTDRPEVQYLQARWKVNRWGYSDQKPMFGLYVFVREAAARALAKTA
jgi:hypothetical protein